MMGDNDVYIEIIDFHEEIEDIKRKLKFLECDSYNRLVTLYMKPYTLQSEIHSQLKYSIEIANNLKHAIKLLLCYNSSTTSLKYIRSKIIYLILIFNYLRKNRMKYYVRSGMLRLKEAVKSLSSATGISINITDDYVVSTNDDRDLAVMMMIVLKETVKEIRHEDMMKIEKGMEELEQVLFEMYVMVQKSYMVVMNGTGELHKDIETLVRRNDELYCSKRFHAENRRRNISFVLQVATMSLFCCFHGIKEIGGVVVAAVVAAVVIPFLVFFLFPPLTTNRTKW